MKCQDKLVGCWQWTSIPIEMRTFQVKPVRSMSLTPGIELYNLVSAAKMVPEKTCLDFVTYLLTLRLLLFLKMIIRIWNQHTFSVQLSFAFYYITFWMYRKTTITMNAHIYSSLTYHLAILPFPCICVCVCVFETHTHKPNFSQWVAIMTLFWNVSMSTSLQ